MRIYDLAVIGGGPGGMMAAIASAQTKKKTIVLERNNSLGKKLLMTGKGRCNFTTNKSIPEIVDAFGQQGKFLYSALSKFSNQDLRYFFEIRGIKTKVERGQRVFPQSDKAETILNCLTGELRKNRIKINLDFRVIRLSKGRDNFLISSDKGQKIMAKNVVLATGGKSYPQTGSSGDGYKLARSLGHQIIPLKPSLIGLVVKNKKIRSLAGLSLKNIKLTFKADNQTLISLLGEMLFTHVGISGPIVLSSSKTVYQSLKKQEKVMVFLDLKPGLDKSQLKKRIYREIEQMPKKEFQSLLKELLPKSLISLACWQTRIERKIKNAVLTNQNVSELISFLKEFSFVINDCEPISRAIVTSGGIGIGEIDSRTMESKIVPHLFFSGEIIALDGPTGGFNLQKAFSTGWLAGKSAY